MFNVGQKVVRTRERVPVSELADPSIAGCVYTISRAWLHYAPQWQIEYDAVQLAEFPDHVGWASVYFRPLAFDFDALLTAKPEDAPLVEMDMEIEARVRELNQVWSA